jgi:hypothetical protein
MDRFQQEALVLKAKVNKSKPAFGSQLARIVLGDLAIATRTFLLCFPEHRSPGHVHLHKYPLRDRQSRHIWKTTGERTLLLQ